MKKQVSCILAFFGLTKRSNRVQFFPPKNVQHSRETEAEEAAMKITVQLYAMLRDLVGSETVTLDLPEGATGNDLWDQLCQQYPSLAPYRSISRIARNHQFVTETEPLAPEDEIALIPPVSGG